MTKMKLFFEGDSVTVTSERAAKAWARKKLGSKRVYETPTNDGWQYWDNKDPDKNDRPVSVKII